MYLVSPESSFHSLSGDTRTSSSGGQEPPQSRDMQSRFLIVLSVHKMPPLDDTATRVQLWVVSEGDYMSNIYILMFPLHEIKPCCLRGSGSKK